MTIQLIEENNAVQENINLDNYSLNKQIVSHSDEVIALNFAAQHQPEIIVLNYGICHLETPTFVQFLLQKSPKTKIIIVSKMLPEEQLLTCLISGASGYIDETANQGLKILHKAIDSVFNHEVWITRKMTAMLLDRLRNQYN